MSNEASKKGGRRWVSWGTLLLVIGIAVLYYRNNVEEFAIIRDISWLHVAGLAMLIVPSIMNRGFINKYLVRSVGIELNFVEWFGLSVLATVGNLFTIGGGGAAIKAVYLKRVQQLPYSTFVSTLAASYALVYFNNSLLGLLALVLGYVAKGSFSLAILAIYVCMLTLVVIVMFFSIPLPNCKYQFWQKIESAIGSWYQIRKDRKLILRLSIIQMASVLLSVVIFEFAYQAIHVNVSLINAAIIATLSVLFSFINLTPAALGIREIVIIYLSTLYGATPVEGAVAAGLIRIVSSGIPLILSPIFIFLLSSHETVERNRGHPIFPL